MKLKPRHILLGASLILSFIADKMAEKEAQKDLEEKVNAAIVQACLKVGMLELDEGTTED